MRVAVTGAAGLTGAEIVSLLVRRGHEVRAVVRRQSAVTPPGAERAFADCDKPDELVATLEGCDLLIHGAGITSGPGVASAVRRVHTPYVMALSSAGVYSAHRASAAAYLNGERALTEAASDLCLTRPTMIYGSERDRNVHHIIRFARRWGFLPVIGSGRGLVQPIHYEDLAAVVVALAEGRATGIVDAGAVDPLTIREALLAVLSALRRPGRLVPVPTMVAKGGARILESVRGGRIVERVERMLEDRVADNARLIELTGIEPRPFPRGVRDQVAAMVR